MHRRQVFRHLSAGLLAVLGAPLAALAQAAWPRHPIRLVLASAPGGGGDMLARAMVDKLSMRLGQNIIIEARPGANGALAIHDVINAGTEGYVLVLSSAAATVGSQALRRPGAVDVLDRLVPVAQIGSGGNVLVASNGFAAATVPSFIRHASSHPGSLNYGTLGIGSAGHLLMEALKRAEGIELTHVPYRDVSQIYSDMRSELITVAFVDPISAGPLVKNHVIKALGITGSQRATTLPNVATFTEQGVALSLDGWYGLFMAKGTPIEIVHRINREVVALWQDPEVLARMNRLGLDASVLPTESAEAFARKIAADLAVWQQLVRASGVTLE
jgi:tripartite-type tricarboxylate transporter receptor subunit TctC